MNIRAILVALIILAVIVVVYYAVLNHGVQKTNIEVAGIGEKLFPVLRTESVEKIKLSKGDSEVALTKDENDNWIVTTFYDYRADKNNINRLLESMAQMTKQREVSSKPENFPQYEVSEDSGVRVQLLDVFDKPLADLIVGKAVTDDYQSAFMRLPGFDEVLVGKSDSNITYALGIHYMTKKVSNQDWVDKQITFFNPDDVRKIELITPESTIVFERLKEEKEVPSTMEDAGDTAPRKSKVEVKWKWMVTEPERFEPPENKLRSLARTLAQIYASDTVDKKALSEYGLDDPDTKAVLYVVKKKAPAPEMEPESAPQPEELQRVEILIGYPVGNNKFFCKRADRDEIYLMMKYIHSKIFRDLEYFKPKSAEQRKKSDIVAVEMKDGEISATSIASPDEADTESASTKTETETVTVPALKE